MEAAQLIICGVVLLTVIGIAYGGVFLLRVVDGRFGANELQKSYFRAGHAHAGVLVIFGLVVQILTALADLEAWVIGLSAGVLVAAILMPAGFFLSVLGKNPERPNKLRWLIAAGGVTLTIGLVAAGAGLITAGVNSLSA